MEDTRSPLMTTEVADQLAALGDQVRARPELARQLPDGLIRSARRLVELTGLHGLPDEQVAVVPIDGLAIGQLVVQLIRPGEAVGAGALRDRLAALGRSVPTGSIATALHRAVAQGALERVSPGRYSRVIDDLRPGECSERDGHADECPDQGMRSVRSVAPGHR